MKSKRKLKRVLLWSFVLVLLAIFSLVTYLRVSKSPILIGKVSYNLAYQDDFALDLYHPHQMIHDKVPVVVFFHGGAWVGGTKEAINVNRFHRTVETLRQKGYAIISVQYTLARKGQAPFPACINDAEAVMRWIAKNEDKYGFDLHNIGVFGESAGAHIALMLSYERQQKVLEAYNIPIRYVVDVYGPTKLTTLDQTALVDSVNSWVKKLPEGWQEKVDIMQYLYGFDPEKDTLKAIQYANQYSPIHYVTEKVPPTLLIHGNQDRVVPLKQSKMLYEALRKNKVSCSLLILNGADHNFINADSGDKIKMEKRISEFILAQYRKQ